MLSAPGERVLDKELRGTRAAVGTSEGEGREQTRVRKESHWEFKLECEGAGRGTVLTVFRQAKDLQVSLWFSTLSAL